MNYDNNSTNKKLQELENQSLPDLSKMDEHWQQMGAFLEPAPPVKKAMPAKKLVLIISGVVILFIVSFFMLYRPPSPDGKVTTQTKNDAVTGNGAGLHDSIPSKTDTILLKARTSTGRDTMLKAVPVESPSRKNTKILLEKFYTDVQKKPQRFEVDVRKDTTIYGKEGTRLYIPANSFDVTGPVTVLLTEYYSIDDMIMNKLTTTCDGKRLVTGGMIYVDARTTNGDLVDLKQGASLRLEMPKQDNQQPMQLFYGYDYYRNDATSVMDSINWQQAPQLFTTTNTGAAPNGVLSVRINEKAEPEAYLNPGKLPTRDTVAKQFDRLIEGDGLFKDTNIKKEEVLTERFGVNITQLGWINCDRFYNDPRPKADLIVDMGDDPDNYITLLVFDKPASVLRYTQRNNNLIRFAGLPEGESVRIVSYGIKNEKPVTAMRKLIIAKSTVTNLKFEEVSAQAYKKKAVPNM